MENAPRDRRIAVIVTARSPLDVRGAFSSLARQTFRGFSAYFLNAETDPGIKAQVRAAWEEFGTGRYFQSPLSRYDLVSRKIDEDEFVFLEPGISWEPAHLETLASAPKSVSGVTLLSRTAGWDDFELRDGSDVTMHGMFLMDRRKAVKVLRPRKKEGRIDMATSFLGEYRRRFLGDAVLTRRPTLVAR